MSGYTHISYILKIAISLYTHSIYSWREYSSALNINFLGIGNNFCPEMGCSRNNMSTWCFHIPRWFCMRYGLVPGTNTSSAPILHYIKCVETIKYSYLLGKLTWRFFRSGSSLDIVPISAATSTYLLPFVPLTLLIYRTCSCCRRTCGEKHRRT